MASEEMLHGLISVLDEFFETNTTNQRKREIEEQLNLFGNQNGAWKHCLFIFSKTDSDYARMFCLSVLESLVNKKWIGVDSCDKGEIRRTLYQLLIHQYRSLPTFIINKLLKVIVDIGRVDWPMFYPDFHTNLICLVTESDKNRDDLKVLGFRSLKIVSEEFAAPREDVSMQRKDELKKLLLNQLPTVLRIITDVLSSEWISNFQRSTLNIISPPNSPNSKSANNMSEDVFYEFHDYDSTFQGLTPSSFAVIKQALECLCSYLSWIPLSSNISFNLLNSLFRYARLGCCGDPDSQRMAMLSELGSLSMTCVNEILSKNRVPQNFEDYLIRVFRQTFQLLQHITKGDNPREYLSKLDENYLDKFIEFLRLFVSMHFSRMESEDSFPLLQFLNLFYKFSFSQNGSQQYVNCLDIWEVFLDFVQNKTDQIEGPHRNEVLSRYREPVVSFVDALLHHIQFRTNGPHLEEFDNTDLDDNGYTEWETHLIENLEILAKIANLFPDDVLAKLYPLLSELSQIYMDNDWCTISQANNADPSMYYSPLKDLSTILQTFGRVSELFISEFFHQRYQHAETLLQKLISISLHASRSNIFVLVKSTASTNLTRA